MLLLTFSILHLQNNDYASWFFVMDFFFFFMYFEFYFILTIEVVDLEFLAVFHKGKTCFKIFENGLESSLIFVLF